MAPARRYDVLGLGALAIDDLLYVDHYPAPESKARVHHRLRQCGGLTGTALVAAARLGARCGYAGLIGEDPLSVEVADGLRREGIDLAPAVFRADAGVAHSTIVVDSTRGTRTVFSSLTGRIGAAAEQPEDSAIRSAAVLMVDHHGAAGTLRALRIAAAGGGEVVADFERVAEEPFSALLEEVGHLVVSRRFAAELTGRSDPAAAAAALRSPARRAVVVTCGAEGAWFHDAASDAPPEHCPAFPVEVVDTTGCGDVFHGAYAAALAVGADLPTRVRFAAAAAALKATRRGGQTGAPSRPAVAELLRYGTLGHA